MNTSQRSGWVWLLCGLVLVAGGCSKHDTERLARVGRKIAEKVEAASYGRLSTGWQSFSANMKESGIGARVSTRLRWDQMLVDTPIEVETSGGIVTLTGPVASLEQRRRAVHLAETTLGVEKVVDLLEIPKAGD